MALDPEKIGHLHQQVQALSGRMDAYQGPRTTSRKDAAPIGADERWITMKGASVLVEGRGPSSVVRGGAGGKFTGKTLEQIRKAISPSKLPVHKNDFSDLGKLNSKETKPGSRRISELPFPGDTKLQEVFDAVEKNNPDWKMDLQDTKPTKVPVDKLIAMQPDVSTATVEHYQKHGSAKDEFGAKTGAPIVMEYQGKYYIRNGTHRTVAEMRNGAQDIEARVVRTGA
jgi:hypothetical protein